MRILLITGPYPPEIRAISFMMQELAQGLALRGHEVTVVASWPQYNLIPPARPADFKILSTAGGVRVIRVKTPPCHKANYIIRGLAQLSLPNLFFQQIKKFVKKIDVVIVYSPPLTLGLVGIKVKRAYGAKYLLNIQDIFPQNAIDLGLIRNPLIIRFFEGIEKKLYGGADKITTHTESSTKFLIENKGVPPRKITTVSNWFDLNLFQKAKATGLFREKYGLKNRFIFLFGGMIGPSQNLDFIIQVAQRVVDIPEICFLIVGDGIEKERLQKMTQDLNLANVNWQPLLPPQDYPSLAKEADVGLVCLSNKNKTPVIPGKILTFMACALPIVAFLNKESDGHDLIKAAGCGHSIISDDCEEGAKLIRAVFSQKDKLIQYGQNGYSYGHARFSKKPCIDQLEKLIQ